MKSKDVRNLIFTLIVLLIGIKAVYYIFNGFLSKVEILKSMSDVLTSLSGLIDLLTYVIIAVIILAIPFYLSKRSGEKKLKKGVPNALPNRTGA
jgi:amino acid transporter